MSLPIELYLECVESLETIHHQIELEKKKLNIVGTDIKATNKKIVQLYVNMFKITATANFKHKIFNRILNKVMGAYYFTNAEHNLAYAFKNENQGRSIHFNGIEVYKESPRPDNQYIKPETIIVNTINAARNAAITILTFKSYNSECLYYTIDRIYDAVKCEYDMIHLLYNQYKIQKIEETFINQMYDIDIIKETYDNQIKELHQQNQQFKQILIENKLLPEPMPEYNYIDIAKRIKPFKRDLIAITKWRKPVPFAVAIPVKTL